MFSLFDEVSRPLPKRDPCPLRRASFRGLGSRGGNPPVTHRRPPSAVSPPGSQSLVAGGRELTLADEPSVARGLTWGPPAGPAWPAAPACPCPRALCRPRSAFRISAQQPLPRRSWFGGSATSVWGPRFLPGTAVPPCPPSASCPGPPAGQTGPCCPESGGGSLSGFRGAGDGAAEGQGHGSEAGCARCPLTSGCASHGSRSGHGAWSRERATQPTMTSRVLCGHGAAWSGVCGARRTATTGREHGAPRGPRPQGCRQPAGARARTGASPLAALVPPAFSSSVA